MRRITTSAFVLLSLTVRAQDGTVDLPLVTVYSPRIANQAPAGAFAAPISSLRYEPLVDIHSRNFSEAQADVTLRGGIFENTGVRVGVVSLFDPQTGHYTAELPIAPTMLGAPSVTTGTAHAAGSTNSTVGMVAYDWRPVQSAGAAAVGFGDWGLNRQEFYQGVSDSGRSGARVMAADVAWARSEADGSVAFGDHDFERLNARMQWRSDGAQTDVFAGYQTKFFGWPNLYTPFNSNETERLQTTLFLLNHRARSAGNDFWEAGVWHRRNKDDYAFNRFAPLGFVHPFQHTTWAEGAAMSGRREIGNLILNFRAEATADELKSTSLTAGNYHSRTVAKIALLPEKTWSLSANERIIVKAGATYDDSNRTTGEVSPLVEIAREHIAGGTLSRVFLGYAETTQLPTYTALNSSATAGLFRGNANLGREKSHTVELGASARMGSWSTQGALFFRRDEGLVDWTFRRGVTARTANAVDIDTTGVEFVARRSSSAVDLVIGYTAMTKASGYRGALVDASFYALNYAQHRLTAALTARLGYGLELRMDNAARLQAANALRVVGGDRALTTALGLAFRPAGWRGAEISVQVDNLWNDDFQDVPAVPAARRQFSLTLARLW